MLSTLRNEQNSTVVLPSTKQTIKGYGYSLSAKLWMFKNYEYRENAFTTKNEIIESYRSDKENVLPSSISKNSLGRIISDLWGRQGARCTRVRKGNDRVQGYIHIAKISATTYENVIQNNHCQDEPSALRQLSTLVLPNWVMTRNSDISLSFVRHEIKAFNGQRVSTEICIKLNSESNLHITVTSQGFEVPIESMGLGLQLENISDIASKVTLLASFIDSLSLCHGIDVENDCAESTTGLQDRFITSVTYINDNTRPAEKRMYSLKCQSFAPTNQCCSACSSLKRNEAKKKSRYLLNGEDLKPNCNERYMSAQQLKNKISDQKRQLENVKAKAKGLSEKIEEQLIQMEEEDHNDLSWMIENSNGNIPPDMQILWDQQKQIMNTASAKGYRWHPKIIRLCLDLYCKNPHVLEPLRQVIHLPSNRTIRLYKNRKGQESGWQRENVEWCLQEAQKRQLKECDFWGGFILDEMKVEENVEMVVKNGKHRLVGFVGLGEIHDNMIKLEGKDGEPDLASHVLQFIFLSDCGFRFPIAQFPSHDCTPSDLFFLFWKGVLLMKEFGFTIYWCILDGAECNRKFIQMHFPDYDPLTKNFVSFNVHTGGPMVFIVDCKHNIKKIRNNIEKSNRAGKPRCLIFNNKKILWSQFVDAYNYDQEKTSIHIHEKLTEAHFHLDASTKMRNHLAEDVLEKRMHYLVVAYKRHLTETGKNGTTLDSTIQLLEHTSNLIEFFCTSKLAVYTKNDVRISKLDNFLTFLTKWREETLEKSTNFISNKLWFDLQSMIHGFKAVVNIKLARFPDSAIKPWIVNQDVVENHFCQVRACNGQNNNPTYRLQEATQNSIRYGQNTISVKSNAGTGGHKTAP